MVHIAFLFCFMGLFEYCSLVSCYLINKDMTDLDMEMDKGFGAWSGHISLHLQPKNTAN